MSLKLFSFERNPILRLNWEVLKIRLNAMKFLAEINVQEIISITCKGLGRDNFFNVPVVLSHLIIMVIHDFS